MHGFSLAAVGRGQDQNMSFAAQKLSLLILGLPQPGLHLLAFGSWNPGAWTALLAGHRGRFWQVQRQHSFWHPWPLGAAEEPVPQINIKAFGFSTPASAGIGANQAELPERETV